MFQSYQFRQINPDHEQDLHDNVLKFAFQSYQFRQINPDLKENILKKAGEALFQSYQFRQINPDEIDYIKENLRACVSIVSIQADQSRRAVLWFQLTTLILRVSIVSIQADQSRQCLSSRIDTYLSRSFNRINSGRSIPTLPDRSPERFQ